MNWISWTNLGFGVWLVVAAFLFRHASGSGITENIITGSFVALAALWAAWAYSPVVSLLASWTVVLSGVWVMAAPFALGYERESVAVGNDVLVGAAILTLALANVMSKSRHVNG